MNQLTKQRCKAVKAARETAMFAENQMVMQEEEMTDSTKVKSEVDDVPEFLVKMTTTIHYKKKGRDYQRCPRFPNVTVMTIIDMMVNSNIAAAQVPRALTRAWAPWLQMQHIRDYMKGKTLRPPGRLACNKYRRMIHWMVRAQIGMSLTRNDNLEKLWGYDIHYDAGDAYYMLEDDVMYYLLPETESTLGRNPIPRMINNIWYSLTHTHTRTPKYVGVVDELGMDDEEYDFIDRVQVEEEDGTWQIVTIHRHKVSKGVCLFYGGSDYEGLPDLYSFIDGVLRDGDGDIINTRTVDSTPNNVDITPENDTDSEDMVLIDVIDHENDMYMGKGGFLQQRYLGQRILSCLVDPRRRVMNHVQSTLVLVSDFFWSLVYTIFALLQMSPFMSLGYCNWH